MAKPLSFGHVLAALRNRALQRTKLVELDWRGNVVWEHLPPEARDLHHEFARLANGNTLFVINELKSVPNFSVPVFRLKQDAIPGRTITGSFKPTITGEYAVQCAEICGIGHGIMGARVFLESKDEHMAFHASHAQSAIQLAATSVGAVR